MILRMFMNAVIVILLHFQQLAVLLITRQVIGNLKESALPYLIENLRLAKICVDVFGALSPSKSELFALFLYL